MPGSPSPTPSSIHAGSMGQGHGITLSALVQGSESGTYSWDVHMYINDNCATGTHCRDGMQLEQNTETIHDLHLLGPPSHL